ncbi:MAG: hypothetical protein UW80_C0023G0003 [Microgenomates group bacterium GW2011_GWC1_44_9]|nr:MAG: hypothetical protein UW80_C0023G0003 [Microgenomates group bacterium GW2011_GWC1_44_9]
MRFAGERMNHRDVNIFKYPGGEIPLKETGDILHDMTVVKQRLEKRGFDDGKVMEILAYLLKTQLKLKGLDEGLADVVLTYLYGIPAEAAVSVGEVSESFFELAGSEVGK